MLRPRSTYSTQLWAPSGLKAEITISPTGAAGVTVTEKLARTADTPPSSDAVAKKRNGDAPSL
jgi:hypothetical protein